MSRLRYVFYTIYTIYFVILLYLCIKLLQIPDATEDAFYLYLKEAFGGYFLTGVITFLDRYLGYFKVFTVMAVAITFLIFVSDFFGKMILRRRIAKLEGEVTSLKARLYDKHEAVSKPAEATPKPNLPPKNEGID